MECRGFIVCRRTTHSNAGSTVRLNLAVICPVFSFKGCCYGAKDEKVVCQEEVDPSAEAQRDAGKGRKARKHSPRGGFQAQSFVGKEAAGEAKQPAVNSRTREACYA
jgi:hypothetical protein